MLRRKRKTISSGTAVDRISGCPDSVLVHILSFLYIEEAVRTQVLSKRWQFLWTYLPSLDFTYSADDDDAGEGEDFRERRNGDFVVFVEKTLFSSDCKLKKFHVLFEYYTRFASNVDSWIHFAAGKGVEELYLSLLPTTYTKYELPQLLYDYSLLKELHFCDCSVLPKGNPTWFSLKKLKIESVDLSNDAIERILGGSPVLEILELIGCHGFSRLAVTNSCVKKLILRDVGYPFSFDNELEISAPYLLSLEMYQSLGYNCRFTSVSSLVDVVFNCDFNCCDGDWDNGNERSQSIAVASLASFFHVKNITLGTWAIQVLSVMEAGGLSSPLLNCESLTLATKIDKYALPGIANLFKSTPNVKALIITSYHSSRGASLLEEANGQFFEIQLWGIESTVHLDFNEEQYWTSQNWTYEWLTLHLKNVTISCLYTDQCDSNLFSFLQILLRNARVLQKMVVSTPSSVQPNEYFDAAKKLLSFPRSSPDAAVIFCKTNDF